MIVIVLKMSKTPVIDGQAEYGSAKQKFRNKEMSGILNCAHNFCKCKLYWIYASAV